jgi:excisionase family DNA binding protein
MSALVDVLLAELERDPGAVDRLRAALGSSSGEEEARRLVYSTETLAAELGVTSRTVRAAIERGDLAASRSGRGYVIGADAVRAWAAPEAQRARRARVAARAGVMRDALR